MPKGANMSTIAHKAGQRPFGLPLVKFTLTYDGDLPSTGNSSRKTAKKWEIRKYFHPQLEELWNVHPGYLSVLGRNWVDDSVAAVNGRCVSKGVFRNGNQTAQTAANRRKSQRHKAKT
jgi:hypothetical protein